MKSYTDGDFDAAPWIVGGILLCAVAVGLWIFLPQDDEAVAPPLAGGPDAPSTAPAAGQTLTQNNPPPEGSPAIVPTAIIERGALLDGLPPPINLDTDGFGRIAERFLLVHGGREYINAITAIGIEGSFTVGGGTFDLYLMKQPPTSVYLKLTSGQQNLLTVSGPDGVFRAAYEGENLIFQEKLTGQNATVIQEMGAAFLPFAELCFYERGEALSITHTEYNGQSAIQINFTQNGRAGLAILHPRRYWLLAHEIEYSPTRRERLELRDYRQVGKTWMPFEVISFQDKTVVSQLVARSVTINPGVLSELFSKPIGVTLESDPTVTP